MEWTLVVKLLFVMTKAAIMSATKGEDIWKGIFTEAFKETWKLSEKEVDEIISLNKKFDFKKKISALNLSEECEEEAYQILNEFLDHLDVSGLLDHYGTGENFSNELINRFADLVTEDEKVRDIFGDKLCEVKGIFIAWGNHIWKGVNENKLIYNKLVAMEQAQKKDHKEVVEKLDIIIENQKNNGNQNSNSTPDITSENNVYSEYKQAWEENLFLNDFDEEDENAGENITLGQLYIEPEYIWKTNSNPLPNLKEKIFNITHIDDKKKKMLLILGQPGIGKSSLISWIINKSEDNVNGKICVYRFTDYKNLNWSSDNVADVFINTLRKEIGNFDDKVIFLDGFDEVYVSSNRESILNRLYDRLLAKANNCTLFVTCRENYITNLEIIKCDYITLQPMNKKLINDYYQSYIDLAKKVKSEEALLMLQEKKDIFGIPIVLYMTLALNISIGKESTVVDVYDKIFAMDGGIYDRVVFKQDAHWIWREQSKKKIHAISKEFALWMFHHEPEEAIIKADAYKEIVIKLIGRDYLDDFLIGNYFKHCEGINKGSVCFVHRSIYEYFLVTDFCEKIWNDEGLLNDKEQFAEFFVSFFQYGKVTKTISDYLREKISKHYHDNEAGGKEFFSHLEDTLEYLLEHGFSCSDTKENESLLNKAKRETNCFSNFIIILQALSYYKPKEYIMESKKIEHIGNYIRMSSITRNMNFINHLRKFCLTGANLPNANLKAAILQIANLMVANLQYADLQYANLQDANLQHTDLKDANLQYTFLQYADLKYAKLQHANLKYAKLQNAFLQYAFLQYAFLQNADLQYANLKYANLQNADLQYANLQDADLRHANLQSAKGIDIYADGLLLTNAIFSKNDYNEQNREYLLSKGAILA